MNREVILLYWDIGRGIVEKQKELGWGESVIDQLSGDLRRAFPETKGFSPRNLRDMKRLFSAYANTSIWQQAVAKLKESEIIEKLRQLVAEVPWGHNLMILNKRSYNLEFLGIGREIKERELENRLIEQLKDFILELGYGFCFIGRQHRVVAGKKEYFIDLLFYHRFLKCLVAIELKIGEFKPEFAGKMDFYLNVLNEKERATDDNPSIGIILCAEKDDVEVEFALKSKVNPIGVAEYQLKPILPKELKGKLPTAEELGAAIGLPAKRRGSAKKR